MRFLRVVILGLQKKAVLGFGAMMLAGCGAPEPPAPPPMPVEVVKAAAQDTPLYSEYIGDIRAGSEVAVFPRIGGPG